MNAIEVPERADWTLSMNAPVDRMMGEEDLILATFRREFAAGREPFARKARIDVAVGPLSLLPADARIEKAVTTEDSVVLAAHTPLGSVLVSALSQWCRIVVTGSSDAVAGELMDSILERAPGAGARGCVGVDVWYDERHGPVRKKQTISMPTWDDIRNNYPTSVAHQLDALMSMVRPGNGGGLMLWHGPPGTGKTTVARALLRAWAPWCRGQYVADPERLFADPNYLMRVVESPLLETDGPTLTTAAPGPGMWRLIVAEDADEYLRPTSRRGAGPSLGRLLNLTDGMLGQGRNVLVLLTTNEDVTRLDPALVRPGRCLARVGFRPFNADEARRWLPADTRPPRSESATLAELFELRGDTDRVGIRDVDTTKVGAYL